MAEEPEKAPASAEAKDALPTDAPSSGSKLTLILGALNTLAILGVLGLLVYTKILYQRPKITESAERERIAAEAEKNSGPQLTGQKTLLKLDPIQANLKPSRVGVENPNGPPAQLKAHFVTLTVALELRDSAYETAVRAQTPKFLDELLASLGNTTVDELSTVQGRFILRSKIAGIMNDLVRQSKNEPPVVTNVYFSDFTVQ